MPLERPRAEQRKWWIIGTLGVVLMTAFCIWFGIQWTSNTVTANQHGFKVLSDDRIQVSWDVIPSDKDKPVTCTLIALNDRRDVLGSKSVSLKPSPYDSTTYTDIVRTTSRAVSGTVKECHYTGEKAQAE
ncbi:DUF4307 domain-containing protein [Dermacoccus nishinomiyaensis]|uniref:DUF4307 domain-containing protein n=1 Tax=Dermacoccus nishinomiyaensis TaxID=1274 RepID=UPI00093FCD84|nr:DUF4307 domain-containing protein [Dermacoccus nishinomiyaensis]